MTKITGTSPADVPLAFRQLRLKGHDVSEITIDELQRLLSSRAFTSRDYTQYCLDRIQATNPYLEAVIETNPDALAIADQVDTERDGGVIRSPLHGVPVLVKDNMATADRMQTTAGSWALLGSIVPKDAYIVQRLCAAGAIIIGKTNLDEWADMRAAEVSNGYSARGGQCRNPFDLTRSPGGSSSGSAVCTSANIVPLAFGTETDASIISPATLCGVVGIKPTVGLTSRSGVVPISETQDTVGPLARTVADAVYGLDVIASSDPEDRFTADSSRRRPKSYASFLSTREVLKGAKFGLPMNRFWNQCPTRQRSVAETLLKWLTEAGATIVPVELPCAEERIGADGDSDWERYVDDHPEWSEGHVMNVEFSYMIKRYLSGLENTPIKSLADIIRYNNENTGSEGGIPGTQPGFWAGQGLFHRSLKTNGVKDANYHAALKHIRRQCRDNGIDAALQYIDPVTGQKTTLDALLFCDVRLAGQSIAAQAGYPIVTVPIGSDPDGMPVGVTLQHTAWQEATLIKWASAVEDLVRYRSVSESREGENRVKGGKRPAQPTFKNHLRKNVPIGPGWIY